MKKSMLKIIIAAILTTSSTANADWSIAGLGSFEWFKYWSSPTDINDSGQIIGSYFKDNEPMHRAFITDANGLNVRNLDIPDALFTTPLSINNFGQVVGFYDDTLSGKWDRGSFVTGDNGTSITTLSWTNPDFLYSYYTRINNLGQMAVVFDDSSGNSHSFITGVNGVGMIDIGSVPGKSSTVINNINDSGQVIGMAYNYGDSIHASAFITEANGAEIRELALPEKSFVTAINNSGQVVGYADQSDFSFITGSDGAGITVIDNSLGGDWIVAYDVNNLGQVVGTMGYYGDFGNSSFLYYNGVMVNLSKLDVVVNAGWGEVHATSINNKGQITGWGIWHGFQQPFLLSGADDLAFFANYVAQPISHLSRSDVYGDYLPPVPEPRTYTMLLAGLALMLFPRLNIRYQSWVI